jgi:arginine metabolism regulation protein II
LKPPTELVEATQRWHQIANQTYQLAKDHIQISLQQETHGPNKARYKDQLMAANILTQYAVIMSLINFPRRTVLIGADLVRATATRKMVLD